MLSNRARNWLDALPAYVVILGGAIALTVLQVMPWWMELLKWSLTVLVLAGLTLVLVRSGA